MARFDVYVNPSGRTDVTPYLVDVQCNLLDGLDSRVVIPLRRAEHFADVQLPRTLMPVLRVGAQKLLLETPKLAAVPRRVLKQPVASLAQEQELIVAALDFLFQGY